jgi:branched-chain amino acid transport system ATP-binding protein
MIILRVDRVSKFFGGLHALNNVSFEVRRGEVLGIIGPNGSGKTTLFNVMNGIYSPDQGRILFEGNDITGLPPHKICYFGIARTFQIPQPFWRMTVKENVMVAARFGARAKASDALRLVSKILEYVGLKDKMNYMAGELLLFDLKRLELARALVTEPKLLLIDELFAGLDEVAAEKLMELIKQIHKTGVTILLIEHDIKLVAETVNRMLVLHKGEKVAEGDPSSVISSENVANIYLGEKLDGN